MPFVACCCLLLPVVGGLVVVSPMASGTSLAVTAVGESTSHLLQGGEGELLDLRSRKQSTVFVTLQCRMKQGGVADRYDM
jgi:hypothetical protein